MTNALDLLRRLGACLAANSTLFGPAQRPGHLLEYLIAAARDGVVAGETLIDLIVTTLAPIWPAGLAVGGEPLGDVGRHPAISAGGAASGLVPFHKLSQWLTYSLIEPLSWAGLTVDTAALTGLPEYRNGGLLVDLGVIVPRQAIDPAIPQDMAGELVVEWRALTVALLDRLLPRRAQPNWARPRSPWRRCCREGPGAQAVPSPRSVVPAACRRSASRQPARFFRSRTHVATVGNPPWRRNARTARSVTSGSASRSDRPD